MKPSVYIETSIVSYLTAWPSSDPVVRAHQIVTQQWWSERASAFVLCTSQVVIDEAAMGDSTAAERLAALAGIAVIELGPNVFGLADELVAKHALPPNARVDAVHLAVAALGDVEYLLTWNCKHLANVMLRDKIELVCDRAGVVAPRICTPLELMEVSDGT